MNAIDRGVLTSNNNKQFCNNIKAKRWDTSTVQDMPPPPPPPPPPLPENNTFHNDGLRQCDLFRNIGTPQLSVDVCGRTGWLSWYQYSRLHFSSRYRQSRPLPEVWRDAYVMPFYTEEAATEVFIKDICREHAVTHFSTCMDTQIILEHIQQRFNKRHSYDSQLLIT